MVRAVSQRWLVARVPPNSLPRRSTLHHQGREGGEPEVARDMSTPDAVIAEFKRRVRTLDDMRSDITGEYADIASVQPTVPSVQRTMVIAHHALETTPHPPLPLYPAVTQF